METDGYNRYLTGNFGSDTSGGTKIAAYALHSVTTHQDARDITVSEAHYTLTNTLTETTVAEIRARKVLLGGTLTDGAFTFQAVPVDRNGDMLSGASAVSAKNDADGKISFAIPKLSPGTYYYKLTEQQGKEEHIAYDKSVYYVKIEISSDLQSTITYYDSSWKKLDGAMTFYNATAYVLPEAGGSGTGAWMLGGIAIILAAALLGAGYYKKRN
ncbi:MAG: LPXTG cell wall anchor domain-containing protein [Lachnospiraceae bacterium]|jgi:pilin isopeptide linkage protein/LPXTG-motif cell wall-anchored protein|nr:LPXTG cell wall anchor domain-containing protein [Lachnospiraceae bacterium]MCI1657406.1 LPXTG cell wall anchor domain-containing protein [Lachnospiraceae bacterium]